MKKSRSLKSAVLGAAVLATQALSLSSAFAAPSNIEAWRSDADGIIVYQDENPKTNTYWFVPKVSFEVDKKTGKTFKLEKVLEDGRVQFSFRIKPYFSEDLRELAAQNISNIRQGSQLKPLIAKNIGISLPDFNYKFSSVTVTSFQYLGVARLVKFTLSAEEAESFKELYSDDTGVNVDFSIVYDSTITDKFFNISVSCKTVAEELSTSLKVSPSASAKVKGVQAYLGADLERAFLKSVNNSTKGVDVLSKGDIPGMAQMLNRVMTGCFEPVTQEEDSYWDRGYGDDFGKGSRYDQEDYGDTIDDPVDSRKDKKTGTETETGEEEGTTTNPGFKTPSGMISGLSGAYLMRAEKEAAELNAVYKSLNLDRTTYATGLQEDDDSSVLGLPSAKLKAKFKLKKTSISSKDQVFANQMNIKDAVSTVVIAGYLVDKPKSIEKVVVTSLGEKKFSVLSGNSAATPLKTKIVIKAGEQWSINAAFVFNAKSTYSSYRPKQYVWDSKWDSTEGDLYFRVGNGHWTPVNNRAIIESGVIGGGELQFYLDRSSMFNKIDKELTTRKWWQASAMYTMDGFLPEFVVQVSGRKIQVK